MRLDCSCHFDCIYYGNCDVEENEEDSTSVDDCENCYKEKDCDYCTKYYCELPEVDDKAEEEDY